MKKQAPENSISILISSLSDNTIKQYDSCFRNWWQFCDIKGLDPLNYSLKNLFDFLLFLLEKKYSYSSINTHKSALSLILSINSDHEQLIKRFMKGDYNIKPSQPKYSETWDPSPVLQYIEKLHPLHTLSAENLTKKLVTLLALTTAHRVQTLSKIKIDNVVYLEDRIERKIADRIKTSDLNKTQPLLILPYFLDKPELCVASVLKFYIEFTKSKRGNEKQLLLTYKKPFHPATSQTISRWIKTTLEKSGINTNIYKSHSTRHAATSAAFRSGVNLEMIRKTAGWTSSSNVFNKFYNKTVSCSTSEFARAVLKI